jgi:hypothetical protein
MSAMLAFVIFMPLDTTPFKVHEKDIVRLVQTGIAGSRFDAKIEGPAKLESTGTVHELRNGRPVLGNAITEFNIKPTGRGKVKVVLTVKPPQPNARPKVTEYEFEVE